VIARARRTAYAGLDLRTTVRMGAGTWTIVGVFDAKGTAFDSEVWADASVLDGFYSTTHERFPVGDGPAEVEGRLRTRSRRPSKATRG